MKLIIDDVWQITMTSIILFNLGIFKSEYLTSFTLSRNICACSGYNNIVLFLYHLNVSLNDNLLIMFSYLDYVYIAYQKSVLSFLPRFTVYGKGILLKTSSKTFSFSGKPWTDKWIVFSLKQSVLRWCFSPVSFLRHYMKLIISSTVKVMTFLYKRHSTRRRPSLRKRRLICKDVFTRRVLTIIHRYWTTRTKLLMVRYMYTLPSIYWYINQYSIKTNINDLHHLLHWQIDKK